MQLVAPHVRYIEAYPKFLEEIQTTEFLEQIGSPQDREAYIDIRLQQSEGKCLPEGWVPCSTYWLIDNDEFIGEVNIRHSLNDHLRTIGGHIGYTIRPSKRKQGYGTNILELALQKAQELGIHPVLITCDETNIGSQKIIERNGGVYEASTDMGPELPKKRLYWIEPSS